MTEPPVTLTIHTFAEYQPRESPGKSSEFSSYVPSLMRMSCYPDKLPDVTDVDENDAHTCSISATMMSSMTKNESIITYEFLDKLQKVKYEKYFLSRKSKLRNMDSKDRQKEPWTDIPLAISYLIETFCKKHQDEMREEYFFLDILHKKKCTLNLKTVLKTFLQNIHKPKFLMILTKEMNAFQVFRLLVLFLSDLERPPFQINQDFASLLLGDQYKEPISIDDHDANIEAFKRAVFECDVAKDDWKSKIDSHLLTLFKGQYVMRHERIIKANKFRLFCRQSLMATRPILRQYIARYILRNLLFQIHLYEKVNTRELKKQFASESQRHVMLQEKKLVVINNLSTVVGPVFIELPPGIDTTANRKKVLSRILWFNMPDTLYRQMRRGDIEITLHRCHKGCVCGFG